MDHYYNLYFGWFLYDSLCVFLAITVIKHLKFKGRQLWWIVCTCALLISIFGNAITMDFRAYWKIMQQIYYGSHKYIHLEPIYVTIINKIGLNYILWEIAITIPTYFAFNKVINNLKIKDITIFLFIFVIIFLYYDCIAARQFLFISFYYWGFLNISKRKILTGLVILSISVLFHKMAYMVIPLTIIYLIPVKNNKKSLLLLSIFAGIVIRIIIMPFLDLLLQISSGTGGESYFMKNKDNTVPSENGSIWWSIIGYYNFYIKSFIIAYTLFVTQKLSCSTSSTQRITYQLVFWSSCIALFFYIIGLNIITGRLVSLISIGLCYLFTFIPTYKRVSSQGKVIFTIALFCYWILTNAHIKGVSNSLMLGDLELE